MGKVITLQVLVNGKEYHLLVQFKKEQESSLIHVSAITADLHSKVYGRYIFSQNKSELQFLTGPTDGGQELEKQITATLREYVNSNIQ